MMREKVFMFGPHRNLTGIVSLPRQENVEDNLPAVIFLNAGFVHQVGPFRLGVDLCRRLSDNGFIAFRFDLSGIGDSMQNVEKENPDELMIKNTQCAMDLLQKKYGPEKFVIVGLCTGADNAHKVTVRDHRITGIITMDGYAYPTRQFKLNHGASRSYHYISVLSNPKRLANSVLKKYRALVDQNMAPTPEEPVEKFIPVWHLPPHSQSLQEMKDFVSRNIKMMMVFTGDNIGVYNYLGQARDMYSPIEFGNSLHEVFNYESDHTFSQIVDRDKLINQIATWITDNFTYRKG